jgi:hypothetical protein
MQISNDCSKISKRKNRENLIKLNKYYYFALTRMRKVAAILLLAIFVFNLFGYRLFVSYMVKASDQSLQTALDKAHYNEEELMSIKTAVNLPYYNNDPSFSSAYGEIEMNGQLYKYVKTRIYNDSLEMLCIPNTAKQQLLNAKEHFTHIVFDIEKKDGKKSSGPEKQNTFLKIFTEYERNADWHLNMLSTAITLQNSAYYNSNCGILHKATVEQPPDIFNHFLAI